MKQCFKCHQTKPLSEFYKHPQMADGRVNKCKECNKADVKNNRRRKIEYYREYDRNRGSRQPPEYMKLYNKRFPAKAKARRAVAYAIRTNKMRPMPCEVCGHDKTCAHHDDYAYPLNVRWLCQAHHVEWHHKHGPGKNGGD